MAGEVSSGGTDKHEQHGDGENREWWRGPRNESKGILTFGTAEKERVFYIVIERIFIECLLWARLCEYTVNRTDMVPVLVDLQSNGVDKNRDN